VQTRLVKEIPVIYVAGALVFFGIGFVAGVLYEAYETFRDLEDD
jgi:hypothetical protein